MVYEVIITTDRTMMSDHHKHEFLGFMTTGPSIGLPESIWMWIAAPKPKVDKLGRPKVATYGLRKIEAALIDAGINASVIDPDHIHKHLDTAKVIMIGHHDYFAYGPPSSEWWSITGKEPVNRKSFRKFMESPAMQKAREKGVKIIAGGPAAWQWLWSLDEWKKWGVTTIVDGEAEKVAVDLAKKALNGEPLPDYVFIGPSDVPSLEEIPKIKHASVNGLVEIMRGCPRGCKFCSVTLRPWRFIPPEKVIEEIKVNLNEGIDQVLLHSEDMLLYYADGVRPRPEKLIKLHSMIRNITTLPIAWSHASLAAVKYAEETHKLISKLTDIMYSGDQEFLGVEIGLETGSVKLAKKIMPAKAAPYPAEKWPEVVESAFSILMDHNIIPAVTLIAGLPEEEPDDVMATTELIDRLRPYRSLIVPMFFVPMGMLKNRDWFRKNFLKREHIELLKATLNHSVYWAKDIVARYYIKGFKYAPVKLFLKYITDYINKKALAAEMQLEKQWEEIEKSKNVDSTNAGLVSA
ncbi:MAG: B12-binding domain-containing radical SAM protein [Caldisphaeraceae archaeon]|nr:B12-binding domain-containing radical SAM protein [Caldisphaeraceae archaeon]MEB3797575.1 B12-binding domain-containing radical SAM protein [Caldisphaeraceae archaeon]